MLSRETGPWPSSKSENLNFRRKSNSPPVQLYPACRGQMSPNTQRERVPRGLAPALFPDVTARNSDTSSLATATRRRGVPGLHVPPRDTDLTAASTMPLASLRFPLKARAPFCPRPEFPEQRPQATCQLSASPGQGSERRPVGPGAEIRNLHPASPWLVVPWPEGQASGQNEECVWGPAPSTWGIIPERAGPGVARCAHV